MAMRKLVIGSATYLWRTTHRHHRGGPGSPCAELFSAFLEGFPRAPLRVVFGEDAGHGPEYISRKGVVQDYAKDGGSWNLNEPGTARALIERGLLRGWQPATDRRPFEIADGWSVVKELG